MTRPAQTDPAVLKTQLDAAAGAERLYILRELSHLTRQSDLAEARSYAADAVALGRELLAQHDSDAERKDISTALGEALLAQADCRMSNGEFSDASADYREARELFNHVNSWPQTVQALIGTSWLCRSEHNFTASAECIKQALKIAEQHGEPPDMMAMVLTEQAMHDCDTRQDEAARTAIESAGRYVREINDVYLQVRVLHSHASIVARQGDFAESIKLHEQLLPIVRRERFTYALLAVLNNLGIALEARNQYARALEMTEELVQVAHEGKFEALEADGLNTLGGKYQRYGEYDSAATALNAGVALARKIGNRSLEMSSLALLGAACIGGGDKQRGMQILAEAADLFFAIDSTDITDHIGVLRVLVDHLPDNCPAQKLIDFLNAHNGERYNSGYSVPMRARIYLGVLLQEVGRTDEAREELKEALNMSRNFESACLQSEALLRMGELENRQGRHELAGQYLRHALFASIECRDWLIKRRIHLALVAHFEQAGEYERALEQHAAMVELDRSILLSRIATRVNRLTKADTLRELQSGIDEASTQIRRLESVLEDKKREVDSLAQLKQQRATAYVGLRELLKQAGGDATPERQTQDWQAQLEQALAAFPSKHDLVAPAGDVSAPLPAAAEKQVFVDMLTQRFPALTKQEVRVAELVRLRTSTKEIARILRISTRAAETYRFRIRRKLELGRGDDLAGTLADLHDQLPGATIV